MGSFRLKWIKIQRAEGRGEVGREEKGVEERRMEREAKADLEKERLHSHCS